MNISADLLKLLAGFVLTTVGGGILTFWFQWLSWRRQARLEVLRQRYAEGLSFVSGLMKLIDRRLFRLQQVIWALEDDAPDERLKNALSTYHEAVTEWNETLRSNHTYVQVLVGPQFGSSFLDFGDEDRGTPGSLHYRFVAAHNALLRARSDQAAVADASAVVAKLNIDASNFCLMLATRFEEGAKQLFGLGRRS